MARTDEIGIIYGEADETKLTKVDGYGAET
jgi:hypothetical protein